MEIKDVFGLVTAFVYYGDYLFDKIPGIFNKLPSSNLSKALDHLNLKSTSWFGKEIGSWITENWRSINEHTFYLSKMLVDNEAEYKHNHITALYCHLVSNVESDDFPLIVSFLNRHKCAKVF